MYVCMLAFIVYDDRTCLQNVKWVIINYYYLYNYDGFNQA